MQPGRVVAEPAPPHISIARQDAATALRELSRQTGVQVVFPYDQVHGVVVGPLAGELSAAAALDRLLSGTGLSARRDPSGLYLIVREPHAVHDAHPVASAGAGPAAPPAPAAAPTETVTITGSYIRRADAESIAPVERLEVDQIEQRGMTSVGDAIRALPADNSGTLPQAFSGALAGGAAGVSLRGLTVDATLVLVDGHRMAPYPLADDGQRPFVDLASLPLGVVDHVEVLKDGASAIYGSDAIAGVVNIIFKKAFVGLDVAAQSGVSSHGDGLSQRVAALYGRGDLQDDGYNTYLGIEFRHQDAIAQTQRGGYLDQLDLRSLGGRDLRGGIVLQAPPNNFAYTVPGMVAPLQNGQAGRFYLLPGCAPQDLNYSGGCTWDPNEYRQIQPGTAAFNITARHTRTVEDWEGSLTASLFESRAEQFNNPPTHVPNTWVGAASGTLMDETNPLTTPIVLGPDHPDNPFNPASPYFAAAAAYYGAAFSRYVHLPALLYLSLNDLGPQHSQFRTDIVRVVADLHGQVADWDLSAALGFVRADTRTTYDGFVLASSLVQALAQDTYRVGAFSNLNSPQLLASLAPRTADTATSALSFVTLGATRALTSLSGGPLSVATGAEFRRQVSDNPGQPDAIEGNTIYAGGSYARGVQTVSAAYLELSAPLVPRFELDMAARADYYDGTGLSLTPRIAAKWKVLPQLAFRGTFAGGFRAPGPAENGDGSTGTVTTAPIDALRCPYTGLPSDCGQTTVSVLSKTNPNLKPETSHSYNLGFVLTPGRTQLALDYFEIHRDNEIITEPLGQAIPVRGAQQPGTSFPGPIIYYDDPYVNASSSVTAGWDLGLHSAWPLGGLGTLSGELGGTYLSKSQQQIGNAVYHYAGTVGPTSIGASVGTPRTRFTGELEWTRGPVTVGSIVNYHSAMKAVDESTSGPSVCLQLWQANPHCYVASFTTIDLFGQFQWPGGLRATFSVTNLMNRPPPLNTATYGGQNYNPSLDEAGAIGRYFQLGLHYSR